MHVRHKTLTLSPHHGTTLARWFHATLQVSRDRTNPTIKRTQYENTLQYILVHKQTQTSWELLPSETPGRSKVHGNLSTHYCRHCYHCAVPCQHIFSLLLIDLSRSRVRWLLLYTFVFLFFIFNIYYIFYYLTYRIWYVSLHVTGAFWHKKKDRKKSTLVDSFVNNGKTSSSKLCAIEKKQY